MKTKINEKKKKDLEFLAGMDKKFHSVTKSTYTPNMSGRSFPIFIDCYTEKKINIGLMEKTLRILSRNKDDLVFYPKNSAFGFHPCFEIDRVITLSPGIDPEIKHLFSFSSGQLHKKYSFEKLSEYFMSERNLELAEFAGINVINDKSRFEY